MDAFQLGSFETERLIKNVGSLTREEFSRVMDEMKVVFGIF